MAQGLRVHTPHSLLARGPWLSSNHSQVTVSPAPVDPTPFSGLYQYQAHK